MEWTDSAIRARGRRAYELGRLWLGLRSALWVVPMMALSLWAYHQPRLTLYAGVALVALTVAFRWRGGTYGRAVVPGLLAGTAPIILPLMLRAGGHCCIDGACWSVCMLGCIGGGLIAGGVVGLSARLERDHRWLSLVAMMAVAGLAGVLGCVMSGAAGIAGMAVSVVATSVPLAVAAPQRSAS